jgi:hypothetical protein
MVNFVNLCLCSIIRMVVERFISSLQKYFPLSLPQILTQRGIYLVYDFGIQNSTASQFCLWLALISGRQDIIIIAAQQLQR